MTVDPLLQWLIGASLALLFGGAAWHKLASRARFAAQLEAYALLPPAFLPAFAAALPLAEGAIAAGLLWVPLRPLAAGAASALLLVYAAAMLANLLRGRRHIDCGCGGVPLPISYGLVLRNALLAGAALLLTLPQAPRALAAGDALVMALMLALVALTWAALGQIVHNASTLRGGRGHES